MPKVNKHLAFDKGRCSRMHPRSCTVKKGSRADRGWSLYACLAVVHFWCGPATRGMCQPRKQGWGLHLPLKESGTKWTLPERLGSRAPRPGLPRGHPSRAPPSPPIPGSPAALPPRGSPVASRPGLSRGSNGSVFIDVIGFLWGAFWRMEKTKFSQAPPGRGVIQGGWDGEAPTPT